MSKCSNFLQSYFVAFQLAERDVVLAFSTSMLSKHIRRQLFQIKVEGSFSLGPEGIAGVLEFVRDNLDKPELAFQKALIDKCWKLSWEYRALENSAKPKQDEEALELKASFNTMIVRPKKLELAIENFHKTYATK